MKEYLIQISSTNKGFKNWQLSYVFPLCILICISIGCKSPMVEYQTNDCKKSPDFVKTIGYNPQRSALSTSEKRTMGLVLVQINDNGDTTNGGRKIYQHPTWKSAGWLGPLQLTPQGNCFVAPIPVINLIDNPPAKQNTIYKVDNEKGILQQFVSLPIKDSISNQNPFGVMGLAYLCESNTLYATSISGSTRAKQNGVLYAINAVDGSIVDKKIGIDAIGMGISYLSGKRVLYIGSARTSDVMQINLTEKGKFEGELNLAFTLANLGPRGDDKVRRIKFDKATGQMLVYGVEFNFNLTAPTEKQETIYKFNWNDEEKMWKYVP